MKRIPTPYERRQLHRHTRSRLYLQNGVLSVRFIKFINEPADISDSLDCSVCGAHMVNPNTWVCAQCGADHSEPESAEAWAASLDMPSPPWPSPEQEEEEEEFDYSELEPDVGPFPSFYTHDRLPWE